MTGVIGPTVGTTSWRCAVCGTVHHTMTGMSTQEITRWAPALRCWACGAIIQWPPSPQWQKESYRWQHGIR